MSLFTLGSALLTAAMAITSVQASPFSGLDTRSFNGLVARDLSGRSCVPFIYGSKDTPSGEVCVSIEGDKFVVTYPTQSSYTDLHVIVKTSAILTETVVGKWPYGWKDGAGDCTISGGSARCSIPLQPSWRVCNQPLYIGVHASFSPDGTAKETGWMKGLCIDPKNSGNCPKSTTFTPECYCPVVTKYAPIVTSVVYEKTTVQTFTNYCTTTPADYVTKTSCANPSATTETVSTSKKDAAYTCPTPAH